MSDHIPEPIWGDPPDKRTRTKHYMFIEKLMERPGEWAEYPGPHSPSVATTIRQHYGDIVEVETRNAGEANKYRVWLRYNEPDPEKEAQRGLRSVGGNK